MASDSPSIYLVQPSFWSRFWWQFRRAFIAAYEDNCFAIAKGAAYSALLSFFPVLTTLAAILVQANADSVSHLILRFLVEVVPPGTDILVRDRFTVHGSRPSSLLVVATLLSLWAASGTIESLMEGFQAVYRLPSGRPFWKQRSIAIMLVFVAALPAVGASLLILFGERVDEAYVKWLALTADGARIRGWVLFGGRLLQYAIALGAIVLVMGMLYYFGPNRRQILSRVWPGALVATALWLVATLAFAWYVRNMANYNVMYGSIGAAIALLVWMYLLAVIALVGCEFNAEGERAARRGAL